MFYNGLTGLNLYLFGSPSPVDPISDNNGFSQHKFYGFVFLDARNGYNTVEGMT